MTKEIKSKADEIKSSVYERSCYVTDTIYMQYNEQVQALTEYRDQLMKQHYKSKEICLTAVYELTRNTDYLHAKEEFAIKNKIVDLCTEYADESTKILNSLSMRVITKL